MEVDGQPAPATIVVAVLWAFNNFESLKKSGSGVYFYIPKLQTPREALIVEKLLSRIEEMIGVPAGTIKIKMLYEEGKFLLDDPVPKYLPEFKNPKVLVKPAKADPKARETAASVCGPPSSDERISAAAALSPTTIRAVSMDSVPAGNGRCGWAMRSISKSRATSCQKLASCKPVQI